jgi:hypothetical protein
MEFGKLQSLVQLDLFGCSQLGCLPDLIVDLSQFKTFRFGGCNKLTNLPIEFGKLQSLVELDLPRCSQLGCLPESIVDLSQLKTFPLRTRHNLMNLPMEFRKLQILVELDLSSCSQLGCLPIHIFPALQVAVQEAGGCLTTKMPLQWEAVGLQGEAVFVDFFSLLVTFSYFFFTVCNFHKLLFIGPGGPGEAFY